MKITLRKILAGLVLLFIVGSLVGLLTGPQRMPVWEQALGGIGATAILVVVLAAMFWAQRQLER